VEFTDGNKATITWEAAPADNAYVEVEWQKQDYSTGNVHVTSGASVTECTNTVYSPSAIRYRSVVIVEGNEIAGGWQTCRHPEYNLVMIGSSTKADWVMNSADELTFDPDEPYVYRWSGELKWGVMRFYTHRDFSGIIISCTVANTSPEATMSLQLRWGDTNLHDFNFGEYDRSDYDVVVDLNNMTITFTRK
jgi:hypothetical protein